MSFYRSQNVLCRSKFFVSDQKFTYILCQSQTFCVIPKNDLYSVKLFFVLAQKFLKRHNMQSNFWNGSKHLDRHKTHFGTCKRTRHKLEFWFHGGYLTLFFSDFRILIPCGLVCNTFSLSVLLSYLQNFGSGLKNLSAPSINKIRTS